jgi:hypothetical protein
MDEDMLDDMGGTPTPMNANRAQQAYAAARGDKRKRKVGSRTVGLAVGVLWPQLEHPTAADQVYSWARRQGAGWSLCCSDGDMSALVNLTRTVSLATPHIPIQHQHTHSHNMLWLLNPQARDYDDDDYIAGAKANRPGDQRGRLGGAAAAAGGPGGLVRSGSEMSLPVGGDQRLNKRMKSQLASKPSDAGRMDMHGRWVGTANWAWAACWDDTRWSAGTSVLPWVEVPASSACMQLQAVMMHVAPC